MKQWMVVEVQGKQHRSALSGRCGKVTVMQSNLGGERITVTVAGPCWG